MKPKKKKKESLPPPLKTFDFGTIKPHIEGLMFNLERDLKKRMNAARTPLPTTTPYLTPTPISQSRTIIKPAQQTHTRARQQRCRSTE
jgi:hypothetical protein